MANHSTSPNPSREDRFQRGSRKPRCSGAARGLYHQGPRVVVLGARAAARRVLVGTVYIPQPGRPE
eukprot:12362677-Alexandrium_andersonii.AAC.1